MTILVPEKRPDKTGKMVTRWVKSKPFSQPVPKNIAPPTLATSAADSVRNDDREYIAEIARSFTVRKAEASEGVTRFNHYANPEQHAYVADSLRQNEGFREMFGYLMAEGRLVEDVADLAIMYDPELFGESSPDDLHKNYISAMIGFRISGVGGNRNASKNLLSASDEMQDKARKYVRLDSLMQEEELHTSKALTTWVITEAPYDFDSILKIIKEHRVTTPQEINGIMEGIAPVLIDGAL